MADPAAPGLVLGAGVEVGADVELGAHVVIGDGCRLGDGCRVEDGVVLGKRPRLGAHSAAARGAELNGLDIGPGVTICTGAVVYAGVRIGAGCIVGDQAQVRERTVLGPATLVGRGAGVDNDVRIGARVRIQSQVYVTAFSLVEDDVFLGPGVVLTNDDTMGRHRSGMPLRGATLRRACRVGGAAVLCPGVEVGEEAFVAAGAVVTRDVAPRTVVMGVPARRVREVPANDLIERWRR